MSKSMRSKIMKYVSAVVIGLAMVYYYASSRDIGALESVEQYHILCDAFTLPGLFMVLCGLLVSMNNVGALDTISYAFHYLLHTFLPVAFGEGESYLDYVEARREKRVKGYGFLFVVGLVFMAVAVIFLFLYFSASQ